MILMIHCHSDHYFDLLDMLRYSSKTHPVAIAGDKHTDNEVEAETSRPF